MSLVALARPATGPQAHAPGRERSSQATALRGATPAANHAGHTRSSRVTIRESEA